MKASDFEKTLITMIIRSTCSSVLAGQEQPCSDYQGYSDWCDICKLKHQLKLHMEYLETKTNDQKVWLVEVIEMNKYSHKMELALKRICTDKPKIPVNGVITELPVDEDLNALGFYPHEHGEES